MTSTEGPYPSNQVSRSLQISGCTTTQKENTQDTHLTSPDYFPDLPSPLNEHRCYEYVHVSLLASYVTLRIISSLVKDLKGRECLFRRQFLAAAVGAVGEGWSIVEMAIKPIWECLVRWYRDTHSLDSVEAKLPREPEPVTDQRDQATGVTSFW